MNELKPGIRRLLIAFGIVVVLAVAGTAVFLTIGRWLVVQDPLAHADIIVVLSGALPERAIEGARLYNAGYADHVWISLASSPAEQLKAMKIFYLGEDFFNEKVLLAQGVRADAIHILEKPSDNTEQEVREISSTMRQEGLHSAIIVTSKPHTRRVRTIWHRLVGTDPQAIVRFANGDLYDDAHWWRHTRDALDVVREFLGLLNAWAGFPLRGSRN